jgi:hypothetical protein
VAHAPSTLEGIQTWELVTRCSGQLRVADTVLGLDLSACLDLARAMGLDLGITAELLPACEAGLLEGLRKRMPDP